MNKKILVLYQDWGNWLLQYPDKFKHWFEHLDGGYDENNDYFVLAFSFHEKEFYFKKNIKVKLIKSTPLSQLKNRYRFKRELKHNINIFVPDYIYSPFIYLLSMVSKSPKYKIIGFVRDISAQMITSKGGIRSFLGYIFYVFDHIAFKKIDIILYNGKTMLNYAHRCGFKGKSYYAPRPIASKDLVIYKKNKQIIESLNLKKKKVILTVSRLSSEKNISMGIEAMKYLPKEYIHIIIGEGPLRNELEGLVEKYELQEKVKFLGYIDNKDIWDYYAIAEVFWLLSFTEGSPNVLQETLYARLPCIVSKTDGMQNVVDRKTSIILNTWDSKELAQKTQNLVKDKIKYKKLQDDGFQKINKIISQNKKLKDFFR